MNKRLKLAHDRILNTPKTASMDDVVLVLNHLLKEIESNKEAINAAKGTAQAALYVANYG